MTSFKTRYRTAGYGVLVAAALLSGCANQQVTQSGFLAQYTHLKPVSADDRTLQYQKTATDFHRYGSVLIDDVALQLPPAQAATLDPGLLAQARADYRTALVQAFSKQYRITTAMAPGTLRVRAAITGLKPSDPALNAATILLIGPLSNGGVSTEAEVVDAASGEQLAALATFTNGNLFKGGLGGYFDKLGHVRHAFDLHAASLRDLSGSRGTAPACFGAGC